ncbi:MAG: right-handed parallel beta-helix repeat-containing protein [Planctomycetota bacterium]|nr:MAG: right-handed parallel beta-helix repeat-containing protein [Planctomycetota bacterium]
MKKYLIPFLAFALLGLVASFGGPHASVSAMQQTHSVNQVFPSDGRMAISSLPFTIDQCGSYFLTDCLTGVSGSHGIQIQADDVTLDLNGFSLIGVAGSWSGIDAGFNNLKNIVVKNGTIRDWGQDGINVGQNGANGPVNGHFSNLKLFNNGGNGLDAGRASTVVDCSAHLNGAVGILSHDHSLLIRCRSSENQFGIVTVSDSVVKDCSAFNNAQDGITTGDGAVVENCTSGQNGGFGFNVPNSLLRGNTSRANSSNWNAPASSMIENH